MTKEPPVTRQSLAFQWRDLYLVCYARDQWAALRRGQHRFLTAGTLDELATTIEADYEASPALRELGPPATADHPTAPDDGEDLDEDEVLGQDAEIQDLLTQLRGAFRQWAISYGQADPGLDRPPRRRDHLPELGRAAVYCAGADRTQGTPGPARSGLGLAAVGKRALLIGSRPAPCVATPRAPAVSSE